MDADKRGLMQICVYPRKSAAKIMLSTFAKRSAAGGVIVWLITLLLTTSDSEQAELVNKVVFWAVLVVVPLGL